VRFVVAFAAWPGSNRRMRWNWYITIAAVEQYMHLAGLRGPLEDSNPAFLHAQDVLGELSLTATLARTPPSRSGALTYRGKVTLHGNRPAPPAVNYQRLIIRPNVRDNQVSSCRPAPPAVGPRKKIDAPRGYWEQSQKWPSLFLSETIESCEHCSAAWLPRPGVLLAAVDGVILLDLDAPQRDVGGLKPSLQKTVLLVPRLTPADTR